MEQLIESGCAIEDMPALAHPNAVLMKYTGLENTFICQPQNVNTSGKVFGGFIMHRAYDLALATCYTFAGSYPVFLESDKIAFRKPVAIGDLLRLKSRVVFTSDDPMKARVVIEVSCQVVRPEQASSFVSNTFVFVFGFSRSIALRKVLPVTTEEAIALINGSKTM
jgi:acyl-coenzyme A thioesterase 9